VPAQKTLSDGAVTPGVGFCVGPIIRVEGLSIASSDAGGRPFVGLFRLRRPDFAARSGIRDA